MKLIEIATLGLAESEMVQHLQNIVKPPIQLGYQATRRGNIIKLLCPKRTDLDELVQQINEHFSTYIFGINDTDLAVVIGKQLRERKETLATAESCTAGKIAVWITSISGASQYFMESVVVYSNAAKHRHCNVSWELIEQKGAVSKEVAVALAKGIREQAGTDWAVAVTGIAGPTGGSPEKPVGTVHIACAGPKRTVHQHFVFRGTRDQVTESTAAYALFLLHQQLKSSV